ncbi:hypothetical protein BCR37DRAFT_142177 [Protomyces lactucae-debilis]|uniref:Uncharacterized protein n=1 Tax=Protomyces lactucae-debilis TaxID=2754530 RepID=A0A1Y2FUT3_PROLT|nr:uncharacterized protein BCR37DRAFT_142177 [Protomyces lactucae-debilis]ORY87044.1 hypothetical protein BCR37DRAFT_142177 [Protomyces lactucae-debilis]
MRWPQALFLLVLPALHAHSTTSGHTHAKRTPEDLKQEMTVKRWHLPIDVPPTLNCGGFGYNYNLTKAQMEAASTNGWEKILLPEIHLRSHCMTVGPGDYHKVRLLHNQGIMLTTQIKLSIKNSGVFTVIGHGTGKEKLRYCHSNFVPVDTSDDDPETPLLRCIEAKGPHRFPSLMGDLWPRNATRFPSFQFKSLTCPSLDGTPIVIQRHELGMTTLDDSVEPQWVRIGPNKDYEYEITEKCRGIEGRLYLVCLSLGVIFADFLAQGYLQQCQHPGIRYRQI